MSCCPTRPDATGGVDGRGDGACLTCTNLHDFSVQVDLINGKASVLYRVEGGAGPVHTAAELCAAGTAHTIDRVGGGSVVNVPERGGMC